MFAPWIRPGLIISAMIFTASQAGLCFFGAPRILAACLRRSSIGWLGPGVSTATLCNDFRAACSALPRWLPRWFELPHPNLRLVGPCACPLANPPPPNLREVMGTMWLPLYRVVAVLLSFTLCHCVCSEFNAKRVWLTVPPG